MARTYNIDSTRNYDIDGRIYHNTSNESRDKSQIMSTRNSDVDARNYSNAMHNTGGAKIFSFKGGGGAFGTGVLTNVLLWLVIFGIVLFVWLTLWPIIKKARNLISPSSSGTDDRVEEEINRANQELVKHMNDRMMNGSSYLEAARWLFNQLWSADGFVPWSKSTDHDEVGRYMLNQVTRDEIRQLSNTYVFYKKDIFQGWQIADRESSLLDDLRSMFSSSDAKKYLINFDGIFS